MMTSNISVRFAKKEDFEDVLEISEGIYNGRDYLPNQFHSWLQKSDKLVFMAELEGKCIGLQVASIADDEQTVIIQALRVHPKYRGKGYSYQMSSAVMKRVGTLRPKLSKVRFTTTQSTVQMRSFAKRLGYEKIMGIKYFEFEADESLVKTLKEKSSVQKELQEIDRRSVVEFMLDGRNDGSVIPNKIITVDWEPYEVMSSNVELIFKEGDVLLLDVSEGELKRGKTPASFSHGRVRDSVNEPVLTCTIYAEEESAFKSHVIRQMTNALAKTQDRKFSFEVFCGQSSSCFDGAKMIHDGLLPSLGKIEVTAMDEMNVLEGSFR